MRLLSILLFLTMSAHALEELSQTVTVLSNTQEFTGLDLNTGRGEYGVVNPPQYRIVHQFDSNGDNLAPERLIQRTPAAIASPPSASGTFLMWNAAQAKPLFAPDALRVVISSNANVLIQQNESLQEGVRLSYTRPSPGFTGTDTAVLSWIDATTDVELVRVNISLVSPNVSPTIAASGSPLFILAGQSVLFGATVNDADGHAVAVSWNFGDGNTAEGGAPSHAFASPGVYNVSATANDGHGGTATAFVTVTVYAPSERAPVARISTSAPGVLINEPVIFDGVFSTDPQNGALTYAWDFGDGSPVGSGVTIAKEYSAPGSYLVTLTVTDAEGFTDSDALAFEVAAENVSQAMSVEYSSRVNKAKPGKDTLTVVARFNAGAANIAEGAPVAVELAGVRLDATLDKKLRRSLPDAKWQVKKNLKKVEGATELRVTAKKRSLAVGFEALGLTPTAPSVAVPVRVECAGKTLSVKTVTEFKYNRPGTQFRGGGKAGD